MSRERHVLADVVERFPRVSGDEPITSTGMCCQLEFSPRERG